MRSSSISTAFAKPCCGATVPPIHTLDNAFYESYSAASLTLACKEDTTKAVADRMSKNPTTVPQSMLIKVVLPAPLGPSRAKISPIRRLL
jgi:hypothetical protein